MFRGSWLFLSLLFLVLYQQETCNASHVLGHHQCAASCGNVVNISHPFRLKGDPKHCGNEEYELSCENDAAILYLYGGRYYVQAINYNNYTIRVVDAGLKIDNCSSLPLHSLANYNFTQNSPYTTFQFNEKVPRIIHLHALAPAPPFEDLSMSVTFMSCAKPVSVSGYVETSSCISGTKYSNSSSNDHLERPYFYVMIGHNNLSEVEDSCRIELMAMTSWPGSNDDKNNVSYIDVHNWLVYGFELSWLVEKCGSDCKGYCYIDSKEEIHCKAAISNFNVVRYTVLHDLPLAVAQYIVLYILARFFLCGLPCFATLLIYKWRRRHLSMFDSVEDFLRCHNNLMPIRYAYSDIKRMTKGSKEKLGEGGYGSVYKAQLRSGRVVAIKVLGNAKANGQDFINEVATIGRIHHVNVVNLIGYCAERSKRALVYEFMPNGSLEKYIFRKDENLPLSGKQMYEISLGVARGIEYLHRGCDIQILHFDIKPHNILLDDNFTPKISDFGLAKLYPTEKGDVTLTAARGTMGYMAPELFYNNIGRVSYKADVYSFGMLLMEMAGRRKNLNASAEHTSQIYFPSWIYDQLIEENDMKAIMSDNDSEEEMKMVKKMIIVALWCIQMKPDDRPSMNKVVEMLEGEVESLEMPPKNPVDDARISSNHQPAASPMVLDSNSTEILLV